MDALEQAITELIRSEDKVRDLLAADWPVGTRVGVFLMHGQVNPSPGRIVGHSGGRHAYVRVEILSSKPDSRYRYRDITVEDLRLTEL